MDQDDLKDRIDGSVAGASAGNSESPTSSAATRSSAIERQLAATSGFPDHKTRRPLFDNTDQPKSSRFGLVSFLILFLIMAAALTWLFTDMSSPLQKSVSTVPQAAGKVVRNGSLPITDLLPAISPPKTSNPSPVSTSQKPENSSPETMSPDAARAPTVDAISIPVADVSLRNRPELLEQIVQVYRSQIAHDKSNSTALNSLNQLQERSLSELQAIVLEGDNAAAVKSVEIVSRLFPELVGNERYQYLVARMDRIQRQPVDEPIAEPERPPPPQESLEAISPAKSISPSMTSSTAVIERAVENVGSAKPEIRTLSIMPGTMVGDRFVPSEDGNVFMVEISYRNFTKISEDSSGASLVVRLGVPGDSAVLAEVPVETLGDRGTKSFLMETLMPGNTGGKYQLNFILNGEFLSSRTVRLSMPEQ